MHRNTTGTIPESLENREAFQITNQRVLESLKNGKALRIMTQTIPESLKTGTLMTLTTLTIAERTPEKGRAPPLFSFFGICATIRTRQNIRCLPYAGILNLVCPEA